MVINRAKLSKRIHTRLSAAIPYRSIHHAVSVIIDQIANDLINDQVVSARHFGTLSPHSRAAHLAHDLSTGKVRELPSSRSVKFHPHDSLLSLLADREDHFREQAAEKAHPRKIVSKNLDGKNGLD